MVLNAKCKTINVVENNRIFLLLDIWYVFFFWKLLEFFSYFYGSEISCACTWKYSFFSLVVWTPLFLKYIFLWPVEFSFSFFFHIALIIWIGNSLSNPFCCYCLFSIYSLFFPVFSEIFSFVSSKFVIRFFIWSKVFLYLAGMHIFACAFVCMYVIYV